MDQCASNLSGRPHQVEAVWPKSERVLRVSGGVTHLVEAASALDAGARPEYAPGAIFESR